MHTKGIAIPLMAIAALLACSLLTPATATVTPAADTPTATTMAPSDTSSPSPEVPTDTPTTASATPPSGTDPCMASSEASVTMYQRPALTADVFSTIALTSPVEIGSKSADGWMGFDPGKAQAANIGIFRLRWLAPDAAVTLSGGCAGVPVAAWVPAARTCYEMVMEPVDVHASANTTSAVKGTLQVGDFAAIIGKTASGWLSVSGDQANAPGVNGFIPASETNVNGPCDSIPTVPG